MNKTTQDLPIIDWGQEAELAPNIKGLMRELLKIFAEQIQELRQTINDTFHKKDFQELANVLHKLQGSCVYCGLTRLKITATEATRMIRETNTASQELIDDVNRELDAVVRELKIKGIIHS